MAMVQQTETIKQGADMVNSDCCYMDEDLCFFLECDSSLLATYDSIFTFSCASLFLNFFAFFCKWRIIAEM
jgi:hypothetical protein